MAELEVVLDSPTLGRHLEVQTARALCFLVALFPLNSWYDISPIDDPLLGVACLFQISNLLRGALLFSLSDEPSLRPRSVQRCPVRTGLV